MIYPGSKKDREHKLFIRMLKTERKQLKEGKLTLKQEIRRSERRFSASLRQQAW